MKLNTIENIYMTVCAVSLYAFDGEGKQATIAAGYFACLAFSPAYKILIIGAPLMPTRLLAMELIVGGVCVSIIQYILREEEPTEMCILFVLAYLGCKPLRFLLAVTKYKLFRNSSS